MRKIMSDVIDGIGTSKFSYLVFLLCGLTMMFDGYDNMIVSYTMPQISKEWGLSPVVTGSLVTWGLLGLMFGGFTAGVVSDRIGRKKTLMASCVLYSIFCGLIFYAQNYEQFAIFRVLSGFGLGACLPVSIALVTETMPTKNRGTFITSLFAFFLSGWVLAGLVAMLVVPAYGWRMCFLVGALPVFYSIVLGIYLTESPRWLMSKGREEEAFKVIQKMEISANGVASEWAPGSIIVPPPPKHVGVNALFRRNMLPITLGLSFTYFFGTMVVYGVSSWLPSLLVLKGYSMVKSYTFTMMLNGASAVANVACGVVSDRIGRKKSLMYGFAALAVIVVLFGFANSTFWIMAFSIICGFATNFAQTSVQPLLAESYPTEFRNTGIAYSQAFGRLGSMSGPLMAGFVQTIGFGFTGTMAMFAVPAILVLIILSFIKLDVDGKNLETITSEITAKA